VAFRVLAAGEHPHFTTINDFRAKHRAALAALFDQVLDECRSAGLVKLGHVAIDGTKMKANASKHKAMSYERMQREEGRISTEVEALFAQAEAVDAAEDALYGVGQSPPDLPSELQRREGRLAKIREIRASLEKEAAKGRAETLREQAVELRAKAAARPRGDRKQTEFTTLAAKRDDEATKLDSDDDEPPPGAPDLPRNRPPATTAGVPKPKAQRNFTDPQSRMMVRDGAFIQAYNAQIAVDEAHQIIVAAAVSNQAPDAGYFEPMLRRTVENCGAVPEYTTADSGYFSEQNVATSHAIGTVACISVGKHRHDGTLVPAPPTPHNQTAARAAMRELLASDEGKRVYARRKATVEPVFGQIRACRGFRQFSFRGLWKNHCEWLFISATHNLLKLFRAQQGPAAV
jgi:hypothetical protein